MAFNLLENPFAVLRLPNNASAVQITGRARELGNSEAAVASRTLLSPRTRLPAELSFLPEATQDQIDACLISLCAESDPDLRHLSPLAKLNVLAHIASCGKAMHSQLRDLVRLQEIASVIALATINSERVMAKMPPVPSEMGDSAIQALLGQHADALVDGILKLPDGAPFLTELLRSTDGNVSSKTIFLRNSAAGWERSNLSRVSNILERSELLEAQLRDKPAQATAEKLAILIAEFALVTEPPREAARMFGLSHEPSNDAIRRWQAAALDLNNRLDAVDEAVIVLSALVSQLKTFDELGVRVSKNLSVCQERQSAGDGTPQVRRFSNAINAALSNIGLFHSCGMDEHKTTQASPAVVVELHDSFIAAAGVAKSENPWLVLRSFTLRLHNDHSATAAALSLTLLAISEANRCAAANQILPLLLKDMRNLRSQVLRRELNIAAERRQKGKMRSLLAQIIPFTDDKTERAEYEQLLAQLKSAALGAYLRWGFWAACAGGLLIVSVSNQGAPVRPLPPATSYRPTNSPVPGVTPDRTEIRPATGDAPLSMTELRWCRYQQTRVEGVEAYLNTLRGNPRTNIVAFDAAVQAYNSYVESLNISCRNHRYRKSEGLAIDAEVVEKSDSLRSSGRQVIEAVYLSSSKPTNPTNNVSSFPQPYASAPAQTQGGVRQPSAPAAPSALQPFAAAPTTPYSDGQSDRRAWETWIRSLSGSARFGAEWWAGVRSSTRPPSCEAVPGAIDPAAIYGCNQAKLRLTNSDLRRRTEPDYRSGWNSQ